MGVELVGSGLLGERRGRFGRFGELGLLRRRSMLDVSGEEDTIVVAMSVTKGADSEGILTGTSAWRQDEMSLDKLLESGNSAGD